MDESSQNSLTSDISKLIIEDITPATTDTTDKETITSPPELIQTGSEILSDMLGIAAPDDIQKDKIDYIWDYYQKGRDREGAIDAMRADQMKLGAPDIGETYLHKFYSYVRILSDIRLSNKEKQVFEK